MSEMKRIGQKKSKLGVLETGLGLTTFSSAFTFALLIIILVAKPPGLFGEKVTDKV